MRLARNKITRTGPFADPLCDAHRSIRRPPVRNDFAIPINSGKQPTRGDNNTLCTLLARRKIHNCNALRRKDKRAAVPAAVAGWRRHGWRRHGCCGCCSRRGAGCFGFRFATGSIACAFFFIFSDLTQPAMKFAVSPPARLLLTTLLVTLLKRVRVFVIQQPRVS